MPTCAVTGCGTGGWTGPLPGDPDNVVTLSAVAVFGGVEVSWTYPTTNPWAVAHTLLFRSASSSFGSAIQIAVVSGSRTLDQTGPAPGGGPWYYWIQIISVNGTPGAVIGPASATPVTLVSQLIEQLTGQIDSGVLANALKTRIDKIDLNEQAIISEANARIAANTAYQAMLQQLEDGVADALTLVQTEVTQRTNGDSALATQLNTVAAANADNAALIQVETQARVDGDSALAAQYTTLNAQVSHPTTGLPATRSLLLNDYYTKAGTDSAIASATLGLVSQTGLNSQLSSYTTTAALQQNYYTKTAVDSAISASELSLESSISTNHTTAMNAASNAQTSANTANTLLADIASDSLLTPGEKPAVVKEYNVLIGEQSGIQAQATSYGGVSTELTAYNNAVTALTTYLNGLTGWNTIPGTNVTIVGATFRTNFQNVYSTRQALLNAIHARAKVLADNAQSTANTVSANLTNNYYTKTEFNSAVSSATLTAQTGFGSTLSSVQQTVQAHINAAGNRIQNIGARYTVVVDANGQVGGFGIYNDGTTVEAGFDCDRFWVGKTNANRRKPFIVDNGVVYIDNAFIRALTADKIDTRGLDIKDAAGNVIFSSGTSRTSANMVVNSDMFQSIDYWGISWVQSGGTDYLIQRNYAGINYQPFGYNNICVWRHGNARTGVIDIYNNRDIPVTVGQRYEFSCYTSSHRGDAQLILVFYNSSGTNVGEAYNVNLGYRPGGGRNLTDWGRLYGFATAPAGAAFCRIIYRTLPTDGGQADSYYWATMFYVGAATVAQTSPSPWSPGPNGFYGANNADFTTWAQANSNSGGPLWGATYIAQASIDSLRVAGNQVTTMDGEAHWINWTMSGTTDGTIQYYSGDVGGGGGYLYLYSPNTPSQGVFLTFSANIYPYSSTSCFVQFERSNNNGASWTVVHQRSVAMVGGYGTTINVPFMDLPGQGNFVYRIGLGNDYLGNTSYVMNYFTFTGLMSIR